MKRVLSVGQCDPDHDSIKKMLAARFDVEIVRAKLAADALEQLRSGRFDLVLVNRKLDEDYSDGLDIIKSIKADARLSAAPCMLVTNYPEHQQAAVAAGAESGFGKSDLDDPETHQRLADFLA